MHIKAHCERNMCKDFSRVIFISKYEENSSSLVTSEHQAHAKRSTLTRKTSRARRHCVLHVAGSVYISCCVVAKTVPVHAMKAHTKRSGITPFISNFGTSWRWVNFTPWYPLNSRLGGLHSRCGPFGEEKISCPYRDANCEPSIPESSRYIN